MPANQRKSFRLVSKQIFAEKCKSCQIYRRMYAVYGEACFSKKTKKKKNLTKNKKQNKNKQKTNDKTKTKNKTKKAYLQMG